MPSLASSIIPLYRVEEHGDLPEQYASGTLLKFGKAGFIATANHCLEAMSERGVFIGAGGKLVGVDADGRVLGSPHDLAYLRLPDELANSIATHAYFLEPHNLAPNDIYAPESIYMFLGFPWRQTKRSVGAKRFYQRAYSYR